MYHHVLKFEFPTGETDLWGKGNSQVSNRVNGEISRQANGYVECHASDQEDGDINASFKGGNSRLSKVDASTSGFKQPDMELDYRLLLFSAADDEGPSRQLSALIADLRLKGRWTARGLDQVSYTLSERRSLLPWRSFGVVPVNDDGRKQTMTGLSKPIRSPPSPNIGFVFSGQGAQWQGMGQKLIAYPKFEESIKAADEFMQKDLGCTWSPLSLIMGKQQIGTFDSPDISQPLCTCLQVALVDLLVSWSIIPDVVIGHSSGEIAAAYAAGAITRRSAWKVAFYRGLLSNQLMQQIHFPKTTMMAVALSKTDAVALLKKLDVADQVFIGCLNAPLNTTLTGLEDGIEKVRQHLDSKHVFARKLRVPVAYHSKFMSTIAEDYRRLISDLDGPNLAIEKGIKVYSTVTGKKIETKALLQSNYWVGNLLSPVNFIGALQALTSENRKASDPPIALVELGPHATLRRPIQDSLKLGSLDGKFIYASVLQQQIAADATVMDMVGTLVTNGSKLDVLAVNRLTLKEPSSLSLVDLPPHPFRTLTYWHESRLFKSYRFRNRGRHDLLGTPVIGWNGNQPQWRNVIRTKEMQWVRDHALAGSRLKNVAYLNPLMVREDSGADTTIELRPQPSAANVGSPRYDFVIYGWKDVNAVEVCRGVVQAELQTEVPDNVAYRSSLSAQHYSRIRQCVFGVDHEQFYSNLEDIGFHFGPALQLLRAIKYDKQGGATAHCRLDDWMQQKHPEFADCVIHPTALDSFFHLPIAGVSDGGWREIPTMVAAATEEIHISNELSGKIEIGEVEASSYITHRTFREMTCSVDGLHPKTHQPLIMIKRHHATATSSFQEAQTNSHRLKELTYTMKYKPIVSLSTPRQLQRYLDEAISDSAWIDQASLDYGEAMALHHASIVVPKFLDKEYTGSQQHLNKYVRSMAGLANCTLAESLRVKFKDIDIATLIASDSSNALVKMVVETSRNLDAILNGNVNPLELIFNGAFAENYYRMISGSTATAFAGYLDALSHNDPSLRILEVGAGTGSTTVEILKALSHSIGGGKTLLRFANYCYTDISPAFFEKAKEKFSRYADGMTFQTLDISVSPEAQGFELRSFDVVVAGSVLHATPSLEASLRNVRSLLKPGGKIMMGEQVNMSRLSDKFVFGLLPGWWLGEESYHTQGALTDAGHWDKELQNAGFTGVELEFKDAQDPGLHNLSALISSVREQEATSLSKPHPFFIIVDPAVDTQVQLASHMKHFIYERSGSVSGVGTLEEAASMDCHQIIIVSFLEISSTFFESLNESKWEVFKFVSWHSQKFLWIVSDAGIVPLQPKKAQVTGLARTICSERGYSSFSVLSLDLDRRCESVESSIWKVLSMISKIKEANHETEFIESKNLLYVARSVPDGALDDAIELDIAPQARLRKQTTRDEDEGYYLSIGTPGLIYTLHFEEDDRFNLPLADDEVDIDVYAASVNFKDVLIALCNVPGNYFGSDGTGVVRASGCRSGRKPGDRVSVHAEATLATRVRCKSMHTFPLDNTVSFNEGATLNAVFTTAHYSLATVAHLQCGERILVHSAAGGVGQAAIQVARALGADIYATVGNEEKRKFLVKEYCIPNEHIYNSRDAGFMSGIKAATNGKGVDVVLNSLSGELLQKSFECLAPFGRFVEIGKHDILANHSLPMSGFAQNGSFTAVDLGRILSDAPELLCKMTVKALAFVKEHNLQAPFPRHTYPASDISKAFAYLQSGKSKGKVVITFGERDELSVAPIRKHRYSFKSNATYLIAGGLGGLGRSIVRWMRSRSAVHFLLPTRSEFKENPHVYTFIDDMASAGANIMPAVCDITDFDALKKTLEAHGKNMPPVRGCIQGSMVLRDALFEKMTLTEFHDATAPKIVGTQNLANLLPVDLDFFIVLSSFAGVVGSRGQANYAAGNVFQDAFARTLVHQHRKCISINLGLMLGVGYAAENANVTKTMRAAGNSGLREDQFLALLGLLCDPERQLATPDSCQIMAGVDTPAGLRSRGVDEPFAWMHKPLFRNLWRFKNRAGAGTQGDREIVDHAVLVAAAPSLEDAAEVMKDAYVARLARVLSLSESDIDPLRPVFKLGVDSLLAVEMRYWFFKEFGIEVAVFQILSEMSIADFCGDTVRKVWREP